MVDIVCKVVSFILVAACIILVWTEPYTSMLMLALACVVLQIRVNLAQSKSKEFASQTHFYQTFIRLQLRKLKEETRNVESSKKCTSFVHKESCHSSDAV